MKNSPQCTICKSQPKIKINILNYCDKCFIKAFDSKIQKNFRGLPFKSRILIYFTSITTAYTLLTSLEKLKNKSKNVYYVYSPYKLEMEKVCENFDFVLKANFTKNDKFKKFNLKGRLQNIVGVEENDNGNVPKIITNEAINVLLYLKTVEDVCEDIFEKVVSGCSLYSTETSCDSEAKRLIFTNAFENIRYKEIQYFAYLNNYTHLICNNKIMKSTLKTSIGNFVREITRNNSLGLFNIINTVKKIKEDKNRESELYR